VSCEGNRLKFFAHVLASLSEEQRGGETAMTLESRFWASRHEPKSRAEGSLNEAKTRKLFRFMEAAGLTPPTHSKSGVPKDDAQAGYAAIYDLFMNRGWTERPALPAANLHSPIAHALISGRPLMAKSGQSLGMATVATTTTPAPAATPVPPSPPLEVYSHGSVTFNDSEQSVEISFSSFPAVYVREAAKLVGYWWHGASKTWRHRYDPNKWLFAQRAAEGTLDTELIRQCAQAIIEDDPDGQHFSIKFPKRPEKDEMQDLGNSGLLWDKDTASWRGERTQQADDAATRVVAAYNARVEAKLAEHNLDALQAGSEPAAPPSPTPPSQPSNEPFKIGATVVPPDTCAGFPRLSNAYLVNDGALGPDQNGKTVWRFVRPSTIMPIAIDGFDGADLFLASLDEYTTWTLCDAFTGRKIIPNAGRTPRDAVAEFLDQYTPVMFFDLIQAYAGKPQEFSPRYGVAPTLEQIAHAIVHQHRLESWVLVANDLLPASTTTSLSDLGLKPKIIESLKNFPGTEGLLNEINGDGEPKEVARRVAAFICDAIGLQKCPQCGQYMGDNHQCPSYGEDGFDQYGYDRQGYDHQGFNRLGHDRQGYDRQGFNSEGINRDGFDKDGFGRDGFNRQGYDRQGCDREGFNKFGYDRQGYDRWGYNTSGRDSDGFDRQGYDSNGYSRLGLNRMGFDRNGLDRQGYKVNGLTPDGRTRQGRRIPDEYRGSFPNLPRLGETPPLTHGYDQNGLDYYGAPMPGAGYSLEGYWFDSDTGEIRDADGYDLNGYDASGFDRAGYDKHGYDRAGKIHPSLIPDADGFYPDGYDIDGFDREGYNPVGVDRYGFGRNGLNTHKRDRNGRDENGKKWSDGDWRDINGYDGRGFAPNGSNFAGFDHEGKDAYGRNVLGRDDSGCDSNGQPRLDKKGKPIKYNKSGWDRNGFDRCGFSKIDGLSEPDAQGRRVNLWGWVYDPRTGECYDPNDPSRRVKHTLNAWRYDLYHKKRVVMEHSWFPPSGYVRPIAPLADLPFDINKEPQQFQERYTDNLDKVVEAQRAHALHERYQKVARVVTDPRATQDGILLRCPECGQFTGGYVHACTAFGRREVLVFASGVVKQGEIVLKVPDRPDFDPRYIFGGGGYDIDGLDRRGFNINGFSRSGFNFDGYDGEGLDIFGLDREGYDRDGYKNGVDRHGNPRPVDMKEMRKVLGELGEDPLNNKYLVDLYSRIATAIAGDRRRVRLVYPPPIGTSGFSTDMRGTITANPYPLGQDAPAARNLVVTRAGIYHELGHEEFTDLSVFQSVFDVAEGKRTIDGLSPQAAALLPVIFNIVEDGRMERKVAIKYPGTREVLAASCRLEPRWDEEVGERASAASQVTGALLYTALPFYRVRPGVREQMSGEARALFEELEQLVAAAVQGSSAGAFDASVQIARRMADAGLVQPPQGINFSNMPSPGSSGTSSHLGDPNRSGSKPQRGAGQQPGEDEQEGGDQARSGAGEDEQEGGDQARSGAGDDEQEGGDQAGAGAGDDEQEGGNQAGDRTSDRGIGSDGEIGPERSPDNLDDDPFRSYGDSVDIDKDAFERVLQDMDREAAAAIRSGTRREMTPRAIGERLHRRSGRSGRFSYYGSTDNQRYVLPNRTTRDASVLVCPDVSQGLIDKVHRRREKLKGTAQQLARVLSAVREQESRRVRRETAGRLDRHDLVRAAKGAEDVYQDRQDVPEIKLASSICVDLSGSMKHVVESCALADNVCVISDALSQLGDGMRHEIRGFGSHNVQIKFMDDPSFTDEMAAGLADREYGGTYMSETTALAATSLGACDENNKVMLCLSDGGLHDHDQTVMIMKGARTNGIYTYGIYLGSPDASTALLLDEIYGGRGNWTSIKSVAELPEKVGRRIAVIFRRARTI